jgi:small subunit ribosomal protein S21
MSTRGSDQTLGPRFAERLTVARLPPSVLWESRPGFLRPMLAKRGPDFGFRFDDWKEVNLLATVTLRDGESQDALLKRFRKSVMNERILSEVRRKRWYISPSEKRRIQRQRAIRRARRKQRQQDARRRYR